METDKKINLEAPNLLTANSEAVKLALEKGIRHALLKHKQLNNPVAVWRDDQVVLLQPDEIVLDEN